VVALRPVAPPGLQPLQRGGVLHPFGHHQQPELVRQFERGLHDGGVAAVAGHLGDEALVDFERLHRQLLEVGQGRITGAVVVDRQFEPQRGQLLQRGQGPRRVLHQGAFGDLEADLAAIDAVAPQAGRHALGKGGVEQVAGRDVDRYRARKTQMLPLRASLRGGFNDPSREFGDETGLLGKRNEARRGDQALGGVLPAQQRFGRQSPCVLQRQLGLQVQAQLAAHHAVAHGTEQRQIGHLAAVVLRHKAQHASGAALGLAHGHFGVVDQGVGVAAVARAFGQTGAGAHIDALAAQHHPSRQLRQNEARLRQRLIRRRAREQQTKLVATQPCQQVPFAHRLTQALRDGAQQLVAKGIAHDLVDVLEAV